MNHDVYFNSEAVCVYTDIWSYVEITVTFPHNRFQTTVEMLSVRQGLTNYRESDPRYFHRLHVVCDDRNVSLERLSRLTNLRWCGENHETLSISVCNSLGLLLRTEQPIRTFWNSTCRGERFVLMSYFASCSREKLSQIRKRATAPNKSLRQGEIEER